MSLTYIKAESFDLMQYFYGMEFEPLIHARINFSSHLDEFALKKAVTHSTNAIPLIRCSFNHKLRKPRWEDRGYTGDDMVTVLDAEADSESQTERVLASSVDISGGPQLRIYLIRSETADTACILINHMVCDGAGFKEYLYLLTDLYTRCVRGEALPELRCHSRGTGQLFSRFSLREKLGILRLKYDLSKQKEQAIYPLQGDPEGACFMTHTIGAVDLLRAKTLAKSQGATLNDMFLTALARVLSRRTGSRRIILPCPVDLRKYLQPDQAHGICNLTSNFICDVQIPEESAFEHTLQQVSEQMKQQKQSDSCLKSVIMLEAAFRILPFGYLSKKFGKIFKIPVLSYSNLGLIDRNLLCLGDVPIDSMYLTGVLKPVPYFQVAVSTFGDMATLSCNLKGSQQDRETIASFLEEMHQEFAGAEGE